MALNFFAGAQAFVERDRAPKARSTELGITEAELVWWMLDGLLLDGGPGLRGRAPRRPWRAFWRRPTG